MLGTTVTIKTGYVSRQFYQLCNRNDLHFPYFSIIARTPNLNVQPISPFLYNMVEPAGNARKVDNWNQNKYIIAVQITNCIKIVEYTKNRVLLNGQVPYHAFLSYLILHVRLLFHSYIPTYIHPNLSYILYVCTMKIPRNF